MKYLLDTDICIYLINHRPEGLRRRFNRHPSGDIAISTVTVYELQYGIHRSRAIERNRAALELFLSPLTVLDFNREDAEACGRLRAGLESGGRIIGPYDLQIAAQALTRKLRLVTNNQREFSRVPGLRVENWV